MSAPVRTIPIWLSLFIILLCLGGGGAFVWWYFTGESLSAKTVIIPRDVLEKERAVRQTEAPRRGPRNNQLTADDPDGVRVDPANTTGTNGTSRWAVKSGDATVLIRVVGDRPPTFRYSYLRADLLNPDQFQVMVATWRLTQDQAMAKAVGLTDDQLNKLRPDASPIGIVMSNEDRMKMEVAFGKVAGAPNDDAAKAALVTTLGEIGKRQLDPTRQKMVERVDRVRALITPEQWEKWKKVGG